MKRIRKKQPFRLTILWVLWFYTFIKANLSGR